MSDRRDVRTHPDAELEEFRRLLEVPDSFEDGFSVASLIGALFIALVMVPGALYMQLVAGLGIGDAAQWVTVLLFVEVAKRANARLSRAQLYILFMMSGMLVGGTPLLFQQYLVRSDAAVSSGLAGAFPSWVAPANIEALPRTFLSRAWLPVLGLMLFRSLVGNLDNTVLGYGLFRLASDVERLPFPMAPVGAMGIMAVAEQVEGAARNSGSNLRWRMFCIGAGIGMLAGIVYMALPTLTGAYFGTPVQIFPIPFADLCAYTERVLPAVATGLSFDFGNLIIGMMLPFFAMVGSLIGLLITFVLNPLLYRAHAMPSWEPGDTTVITLFKNNIDFYFSFGVGIALAIALYGIWVAFRTVRRGRPTSYGRVPAAPHAPLGRAVLAALLLLAAAARLAGWRGVWAASWAVGLGAILLARRRRRTRDTDELAERRRLRGDIPDTWIGISYLFCVSAYLAVSGWLIGWDARVMWILLFFGFLYTPLISYVTARLEGLAGQVVEIPLVREMAFIFSGYKGVAIWFLPVPQSNYGTQTVRYKQAELLGCKFTSMWKSQALLVPIVFLAMLLFSSFIWSLGEIPSSVYPFTMEMWDLQAKNACILYSSTLGEYSPFREALGWRRVLGGFGSAMVAMSVLGWFRAPVTLFFGVVRGLGQTLPHSVIPNVIGAVIGRYYFQRRYGAEWRKMIPVVGAGFFVGQGLVSMLAIGLVFLMKAVTTASY